MSWASQLRQKSWNVHPKGSNWMGYLGYHGITAMQTDALHSHDRASAWDLFRSTQLFASHRETTTVRTEFFFIQKLLGLFWNPDLWTSAKDGNSCSNHINDKSMIIIVCFLIQEVYYVLLLRCKINLMYCSIFIYTSYQLRARKPQLQNGLWCLIDELTELSEFFKHLCNLNESIRIISL